ncbi:Armadillo-like helical [Cordyceps fumosorosea ARSEF 2679]|uniref:Armadillo-like helical n=1 Tax=Cordyceps fumosorosea (strain ARSEF 2679) TaxID=1081104 RepID=A0A166X9N0_CORFA|nr:Armadillo-like helical [Cordyceps fumosorosea ARSEF 2679]OAA35576.1 Armadillo-like helical [Cordyceps fumosorosea ARSEF 2679]
MCPSSRTSCRLTSTRLYVGATPKTSLILLRVSYFSEHLIKNHNAQLSNLADAFGSRIAPNERRPRKVPIISFYETKKTYLLGLSLGVVVSRDSATVHADCDKRHSIETDHSGLNKCGGPTDTLFTELAAAIQRLKTPSLLDQADTWIRDKHYTADRLKIERLSGESLSMDQCYINLAIVGQSGLNAGHLKKGGTAPSPFSILARQKVEAPDKTMQVDLAAIFNERKGSDGQPMHPRRILIRGRAGVGKTTLCKKIVHEFTKGTWAKWNELFDRVLWVPLRNLKLPERRKKAKYTLEHLFSHEFLLPTDGPNLARALSCALETKSSKTLFLLDGLDEVSQDLTGNGSMACFLAKLLTQPYVVITTRPSAKPPLNLDLELETIGFGPDQVNEYIEKSFTNPKTSVTDRTKVDKVQSFLEERWLIQGLVRIPIQLDALCYTWDDLKPDAILNTMTAMYKEIELKLWKKDVLRLKKKHEDKELTEENIATAGRRKIEGFVRDEMVFIESLAFTGLYNDVIDFTSEHLDSISDRFAPNLLPDKTLPSLSFLRTSDLSSEYRNQNYHFIHLTFQEYFAARYFVRQWKDPEGQLWSLTLSSMNTRTKASPPAEFLRKHKYTARYDIFWRFVAGLLDGSDQSPDFIATIEEEPLDLLGPTHQRLVMHCLSEISSDLPARKALEERLAQWLLFECKFNKSASLASEVEFPEVALKTALLDESSDVRKTILQSLASRASIPQSIAKVVAGRLGDEAEDMRRAAVEALGGRAALPDEVLTAVAARLGDEAKFVRSAAIKALDRRAVLPDKVLTAVAARLGDEHKFVRSATVQALGGRAALPDKVLTAIAARLSDEAEDVQSAAIQALGGRAALPGEVLTAVAARLGDKHWFVRSTAVEALGGRAALPSEVLTAVAARLGDEAEFVRRAAIKAIGGRAALPSEVLMAVAARLGDEHWFVRSTAVEALGGRAALPDEVLTAVAAQLGDEAEFVRRAAIEALVGHTALPGEVLTAVAARLGDEHWFVRSTAVQALGGRAALPGEVLTAVAARLGDEDKVVRRTTVEALGRRAALLGDVLTAVAARLGDEDKVVRRTTVEALGGHTALPNEVLTAIAARLSDEHEDVRRAAIQALGGRAVLPNKVLTAVVARLSDEAEDVRRATVQALGGRTALPNEVLTAVAARLSDEAEFVRRAAIEALGGRAPLPDKVLTAVAARLGDEAKFVRSAAIKALGRRAVLPDKVLTAVAARLSDEAEFVRRDAIEALGGRAALPDEALTAVAARLSDEAEFVRRAAVDILMQRHGKFCFTLLKGPLISSLYKALLERSFKEQLSWYIAKDNSYINMPDGITEFSVDIQQNEFWDWINGARPADCPSTSGGESLSHNQSYLVADGFNGGRMGKDGL